ncbi:hypothetical protein GFS31_21460 [Leptolyngbya sp. BL0902]|nr:hypothetical protein GFS31_21460 [Leptolyngbya sp. BL0902]
MCQLIQVTVRSGAKAVGETRFLGVAEAPKSHQINLNRPI